MSDVQITVVPDEAGGAPVPQLLEILANEELQKAVKYLQSEYEKASNEMQGRNKRAFKWRRAMEALASDAPKTTPMKNASNVTVPLTQTLSQALVAKIKGTFDARDPFWTVGSQLADEPNTKKIKVIQKYLNMLAESPTDLDMETVKKDLFGEAVLIGGCFPKVIYSIEKWKIADESGAQKDVTYHDGPEIIVIPVERAFYRRGINSISRLPWIGLDTPLTENELREKASRGEYSVEAVQEVLGKERTSANDAEAERQKAEWFDEAEQTGLYDITEFWFYWDIDGSGIPVDLFFTMHVPSGQVLQQQYNSLGKRFVVAAKYMHRSFSLTGRGAGQMTESMNDEATGIHNLSNDNMKISNMRMFAIKRQAGFKAEETIFPGKMFALDNPREDIQSIPIGEIYPSIAQAENKSWGIAQRAIGLSDSQMGFADQTLGSRDTARGQAMRLQSGDSVLGTVTQGLVSTFSELGMLVWMQLVANKERVMQKERTAMRLSGEDLSLLEEALNMELSDVPMKLAFTVRTTDAEKTFEQQRQNMMALTQIYAQFATQTIPLAMQVYGPQGQQMAASAPDFFQYLTRILTGSGKLMDDIFKFFGITNSQEYVPDQQKMEMFLDMLQGVGASFAGVPQAPGMQQPGGQQGLPPPSSPSSGPEGAAGAKGPGSSPLLSSGPGAPPGSM